MKRKAVRFIISVTIGIIAGIILKSTMEDQFLAGFITCAFYSGAYYFPTWDINPRK